MSVLRWRRIAASVASSLGLGLVMGSLPGQVTPALASQTASVVPVPTSSYTTMTPSQIIAASKKKDKKAFAKWLAKLKTSTALVDLVKATVPSPRVSKYLQLLAALSTNAAMTKVVAKAKGKHFKVTMASDGAVKVKLLKAKGKPVVLNAGPECWEAWVAVRRQRDALLGRQRTQPGRGDRLRAGAGSHQLHPDRLQRFMPGRVVDALGADDHEEARR
jgi:hypothetical protein